MRRIAVKVLDWLAQQSGDLSNWLCAKAEDLDGRGLTRFERQHPSPDWKFEEGDWIQDTTAVFAEPRISVVVGRMDTRKGKYYEMHHWTNGLRFRDVDPQFFVERNHVKVDAPRGWA
jgi:hypothetical protein